MVKKTYIKLIILIILLGVFISAIIASKAGAPAQVKDPDSSQQSDSDTKDMPADFNIHQNSLTEPASLWFVANKHFALPLNYVPSDLIVPAVPLRLAPSEQQMNLRKLLEPDLSALFKAGKAAGLQLQLGSGYRSAAYQKVLYDGYVRALGTAEADRSSARPGHSEHQTGLALDFTRIDGKCHLESCFGNLPEGKWLTENAYLYGFILRYTQDKEHVTGYIYEPWHYRFVGKELAKEMHDTDIKTLEEFFGLATAPDYL